MSKLIYCKFLDSNGEPRGRNYTYRSDYDVEPGQFVEVHVQNKEGLPIPKKVLVIKSDVKPDNIPGYDNFKDKIKNIQGIWQNETDVKLEDN